jgi:formyl-CoA transferase
VPGVALWNVYRCKAGDDLIGDDQNRMFQRRLHAMGRPEQATDPLYVPHVHSGKRSRT